VQTVYHHTIQNTGNKIKLSGNYSQKPSDQRKKDHRKGGMQDCPINANDPSISNVGICDLTIATKQT